VIFYRCKCGQTEAWGSMPPSPCTGCSTCKTTLEASPGAHSQPIPHEFVERFDHKTGKPYDLCTICLRTRWEIEKGDDE